MKIKSKILLFITTLTLLFATCNCAYATTSSAKILSKSSVSSTKDTSSATSTSSGEKDIVSSPQEGEKNNSANTTSWMEVTGVILIVVGVLGIAFVVYDSAKKGKSKK